MYIVHVMGVPGSIMMSARIMYFRRSPVRVFDQETFLWASCIFSDLEATGRQPRSTVRMIIAREYSYDDPMICCKYFGWSFAPDRLLFRSAEITRKRRSQWKCQAGIHPNTSQGAGVHHLQEGMKIRYCIMERQKRQHEAAHLKWSSSDFPCNPAKLKLWANLNCTNRTQDSRGSCWFHQGYSFTKQTNTAPWTSEPQGKFWDMMGPHGLQQSRPPFFQYGLSPGWRKAGLWIKGVAQFTPRIVINCSWNILELVFAVYELTALINWGLMNLQLAWVNILDPRGRHPPSSQGGLRWSRWSTPEGSNQCSRRIGRAARMQFMEDSDRHLL